MFPHLLSSPITRDVIERDKENPVANSDVVLTSEDQARATAQAFVARWARVETRQRFKVWYIIVPLTSLALAAYGNLVVMASFSLGIALGLMLEGIRVVGSAVVVAEELVPALQAVPDGLENPVLGLVVLHRAKLMGVRPGRRRVALRAAAAWVVGPEGPANFSDCQSGHPTVCSHRCPPASLRLWENVARAV